MEFSEFTVLGVGNSVEWNIQVFLLVNKYSVDLKYSVYDQGFSSFLCSLSTSAHFFFFNIFL